MRKAFLSLDTDYDGFITVENVLKYFGNDRDFNFLDLQKLFKEKDSKGEGKINYQDFSKWLGRTIHMAEGFMFRHDSIKNPDQEQNQIKQEKLKGEDKASAKKVLLKDENAMQTVVEKMKF